MTDIQKKDKTLILRFSALGDVAMTIPIVYEVCRAYPNHQFIFVTKKSVAALFINTPENLTIYPADTKGRHKGLKGIWTLYKELRTENFKYIADLHNVLRTRVLDLLLPSSKCVIINKGRKEKKHLTKRYKNKSITPLKTSFERYADVFEKLGFRVGFSFRSVFTDNPDTLTLPDIIEPPLPGEIWIGIAPFAKHPGKILPSTVTEKVIETLSKRENCRIFLMGGGQAETSILQNWAGKYPKTISLAGLNLGFATELSLIRRMSAMMTMDSANMHLASLAGIPVVSIWGQTHHYAGFLGWQQNEENIIQIDLSCRPCSIFGNKPCHRGDYACLQGFDANNIIQRIDAILQQQQNDNKL